MELPPPPPTEALGDAPVSEVAPPAAPETADEESQEAKDIQKVYAMRDAIMKGATDQGVETKEGLLDLFMARALDAADESGDMKVVPRASFGIDVTEASVAWITSHFVIGDEAEGAIDVAALLNYLQLTPEAEEQTILSALHDKLRDGAEKLGITTKEELCALIISLADCVADADDGADVVDRARLAEAAKGLSESITAGATDEDAEALDADEFWRALGLLDASLSAVAAERTAAAGVATLVDEVYTNEDGTIDAVHLLHDLRLWPGVEESAHWDALAEDLRSRLCEGAQAAGIKTKEAFCQLFADADGRPRKMGVEEFVTTCRDHLGLDLSAAADDGEARDEGELVQFVRWFTVEEDGEEAVDVGELLWKLLLWPGSEEEHRSLNAGRQLRQELLAAAEGQELETVGDLYTALVARCHGGADAPAADASLVDDAALQVIALPKLLDALAESFGVDRTADLEMYLQHFPPTDSEAEAEKEEATVPFEEKKVDLKRLLQHLELFDQDEEPFDDDNADDDDEEDDDDDETVTGETAGEAELAALVLRAAEAEQR